MRFCPLFSQFWSKIIWLHSGGQELSIEYNEDYFRTKIKNTKLSVHIWACAWHVALLAQRSKNFDKSFPYITIAKFEF